MELATGLPGRVICICNWMSRTRTRVESVESHCNLYTHQVLAQACDHFYIFNLQLLTNYCLKELLYYVCFRFFTTDPVSTSQLQAMIHPLKYPPTSTVNIDHEFDDNNQLKYNSCRRLGHQIVQRLFIDIISHNLSRST